MDSEIKIEVDSDTTIQVELLGRWVRWSEE